MPCTLPTADRRWQAHTQLRRLSKGEWGAGPGQPSQEWDGGDGWRNGVLSAWNWLRDWHGEALGTDPDRDDEAPPLW